MSYLTIRQKKKNKHNPAQNIGLIEKFKTPQSQKFLKILGTINAKNHIIKIDYANLSKELARGHKISQRTFFELFKN